MKSYKGLKKDYWLFWVASSLGMGASNILQYVLSLYVLDITGSATLFASMLSIIIFPRIFTLKATISTGAGSSRRC